MKSLKYHNKKTIVQGITFDSKLEAKRFQELKLLERAREIEDLQLQPSDNSSHLIESEEIVVTNARNPRL